MDQTSPRESDTTPRFGPTVTGNYLLSRAFSNFLSLAVPALPARIELQGADGEIESEREILKTGRGEVEEHPAGICAMACRHALAYDKFQKAALTN